MPLPNLLTLLPLLISALALPAPTPDSSTPSATVDWVITDFQALVSPSDEWADFTFQDTDPNNAITLQCSIEKPVYLPAFTACGPKLELLFKMSEGEVVLRRTYTATSGQRITGVATQGTYWDEGQNGNVTTTEDGKLYTRTTDWYFPISSVVR